MEMIKLRKNIYENYDYVYASNLGVNLLGDFLISDVHFSNVSSFQDWAFDPIQNYTCSNVTILEKLGDNVYLRDLLDKKNYNKPLIMTRYQFFQILVEWGEKVCLARPQEVIIKHDNDQFWIETSD